MPASDPLTLIMNLVLKIHNAEVEKTSEMRKRGLRKECLLEMQTCSLCVLSPPGMQTHIMSAQSLLKNAD
jgi:hypothetical protein